MCLRPSFRVAASGNVVVLRRPFLCPCDTIVQRYEEKVKRFFKKFFRPPAKGLQNARYSGTVIQKAGGKA